MGFRKLPIASYQAKAQATIQLLILGVLAWGSVIMIINVRSETDPLTTIHSVQVHYHLAHRYNRLDKQAFMQSEHQKLAEESKIWQNISQTGQINLKRGKHKGYHLFCLNTVQV